MWVRVIGSDGDAYVGLVDNDPDHFETRVLTAGTRVTFRPEHVLDTMEA